LTKGNAHFGRFIARVLFDGIEHGDASMVSLAIADPSRSKMRAAASIQATVFGEMECSSCWTRSMASIAASAAALRARRSKRAVLLGHGR
jgi:hypothetical protein